MTDFIGLYTIKENSIVLKLGCNIVFIFHGMGSYINFVFFSKRPKWTEAVLQLNSSFTLSVKHFEIRNGSPGHICPTGHHFIFYIETLKSYKQSHFRRYVIN